MFQRATANALSRGLGLSDMPLDHTLGGRMERRLPIIVVVRLAQAVNTGAVGEERTYTDNISPRGARLFSTRPWQPGDSVRIAPRDEDPVLGNVVYCQTLPDGRFVVGVNFQDRPIKWSAMHRYDGSQSSLPAKSQ
jgi:PilZ domain